MYVASITKMVGDKLNSRYGARIARIVPDGVRRRIPRRRTLIVIAVAVGLLVVTPLQILGASADSTSSHVAHVPSVNAPVDPAPADKAPAPVKKPAEPTGVSPEQMKNATAIAKAATDRGMSDKAISVALATSLQESNLKNINYGDRDSLGLFQQRPSTGWGTPDQILNPEYSAGKFLDRLQEVPGWEHMPVTNAAQTVQRSAFPDAYAKWQPLADHLAPIAHAAADAK